MLTNPGEEPVQVDLWFYSSDGQEFDAIADGEGGVPRPPVTVGPGAVETVSLSSDPNVAPRILWAVADTTGPLQVFSSFDSSVPAPSGLAAASYLEQAALRGEPYPAETHTPPSGVGGPPSETPGLGPPPGGPPGKPDEPGGGRPPVTVPGTTASIAAKVTNVSGAVAAQGSESFLVAVSIDGAKGYNAAVALANAGNSTATVTMTLTHADGLQKLIRVVQVPPVGQVGGMLTDPALFGSEIHAAGNFQGSLAVCSDSPIGLLALGFAGELTFTLPASRDYQCAGAGR